jgi:hypothetical protein
MLESFLLCLAVVAVFDRESAGEAFLILGTTASLVAVSSVTLYLLAR